MNNLQILIATMHQSDLSIAKNMNIRCDAVIANQADCEEIVNADAEYGAWKMITTATRGVGLNRNIALMAAQGMAAAAGRDFVLPDDIKDAAIPVLAHRFVLKNDFYRSRGHDEEIIARLLEQVAVPTEPIDFYRYS